jgi:hypothetical protein
MKYEVPICDLPQSEMYWHLELPQNIDRERIMVNLGTVARIMRLGGLSAVDVRGYQGDVTQYSHGVAKRNADGSANASATFTVQKAETHVTDVGASRDPRNRELHTTNAEISVNATELYDRVRAADQAANYTLDWHELYAKELNRILRTSIPGCIKEHLITNVDAYYKLMFGFLTVAPLGLAALNGNIELVPIGILGTHTIGGNLTTAVTTRLSKTYHPELFSKGDNPRFSVFYGLQYDRLAAVHTLARTNRLVRALP